MMANDYRISGNSISTRNPEANMIVERAHQIIGIIICILKIQQMDLEDSNPEQGILLSTMFAIRSMVHTAMKSTPSQLVFSRYMMLNINQGANWQLLKQCARALINKDNQKEKSYRQSHVSRIKDKV